MEPPLTEKGLLRLAYSRMLGTKLCLTPPHLPGSESLCIERAPQDFPSPGVCKSKLALSWCQQNSRTN